MTEKYKEFKKWVDNKFPTPSKSEQIMGIDWERIFNDFEEEQEEKQREIEIKNIIKKVVETTKKHTFTGKNFEDVIIEGIYIELKKEGYLK